MHIVIEAIDGAGKGTVTTIILDELAKRGREVLMVAEPTKIGLGKFIREELIAKHADGHTYSGRTAAIAYAMDREQLYLEKVIPFLEGDDQRVVVQDRSLLTSLVYQPTQDASVTAEWLLSLEGNRLEIEHAPDALLLLRIDPAEAERRLTDRTDKKDNSVFEKRDFQEKAASRYLDPAIQAPYLQAGTKILVIDAGGSREEVAARVKVALNSLL